MTYIASNEKIAEYVLNFYEHSTRETIYENVNVIS